MNFKHINYVLTVLTEGSITAASKKLFVSQPALSQTIKLIEQDLGAPIFDRSTDPISLTYAGQRYVEAAQAMLDIDRNLRAEIAETKKRCTAACAWAFPASAAFSCSPHHSGICQTLPLCQNRPAGIWQRHP
ncbi:MAG: LysR family transcriptional regulator [Christensenellales bacterium]